MMGMGKSSKRRERERMASTKKGRVVTGALAMPKQEYARMMENVASDPTLAFVAKHGKRATWLRAAIAEKCETQEKANGKAAK